MSGGGADSRVSIPEDVRTMIRNIKDTTGKQHADEDVYAVLKECAMDADETAQKLLYLDTFHQVKSKRERKKEISNSKVYDSKFTSYSQGWARGNRNFSSNHGSSGGARTLPVQRDKRAHSFTERVSGPAPTQQKSKDAAAANGIKASTVAANGPSSLPNGISTPAQTPNTTVKDVVPASASGVASELYPALASSVPQQSGVGPVKRDMGLKHPPSGNSVYKKKVLNNSEEVKTDKAPEKNNGSVKEASVPLEVVTTRIASVCVEASSQSSPTSIVSDTQNVTFPDHFVVSEASNSGFTFGSFGATESVTGPTDSVKTNVIAQPSQGSTETMEESSPSNQAGDLADHCQPSYLVQDETTSPSENNFTHEDPKSDTLLPPDDPQNPVVQDVPTHSLGFISPMSNGSTLQDQDQDHDHDLSRPSYFVNGTVPAFSSPSPTPTAQTSSTVSPQQIPVYRQPYPYVPYGHYLTPFYIPPMHQLMGHNAFNQQLSAAGNLYLPPTMAAPAQGGLKLPFTYKPGNNTPVGIPSGYSAYSATPAVTSANNEDLASSLLKENHMYSTAQLSEAPAVWVPPLGQDLNSLQVNSMYNHLPQGQQISFSPGLGAFGIQQPQQTMAGVVPTVQTVIQQSQAGGAVETVGLPSGGSYQLPQHAQINWNTNF